nr:2-C-methyl-D-erythritol 4-phosphate cytidylyltransferase [uncultured Carboxylicivirga sp.]
MNIAVILAGGSGQRMSSDCPKQFIKVAGKMIIEHTIDVFQTHKRIDEIIVVSNSLYISDVQNIVLKNKLNKVKKILQGGQERYHSSIAAIQSCERLDQSTNLIFHDAVRPLVSHRIIDDCIDALEDYNAVDVVIPTVDTIIEASENNNIANIPNRNKLRNGQTPQAFKLKTINEAYQLALADPNLTTTDDCGVVKRYLPEEPIYLVDGESFNMKLTYKEDLHLMDKIFQLKTHKVDQQTINEDVKLELKDKVIIVFGGSYGIGNEIVNICNDFGVKVYSFSRSQNNTDISNIEHVRNALKHVYEIHKKIDYVVSSAGILVKEALCNMDYDSIVDSVNINLLGSIIVAKESYAFLKESAGSMLLYTSSSYTRGRSFYSTYSATKAAIVNLVQALSEEWLEDNIRINCVNPERTKTPMRVTNFGIEPNNSLLDPKEVAVASINTLMSCLTGEVIDVKIKK